MIPGTRVWTHSLIQKRIGAIGSSSAPMASGKAGHHGRPTVCTKSHRLNGLTTYVAECGSHIRNQRAPSSIGRNQDCDVVCHERSPIGSCEQSTNAQPNYWRSLIP
jgi:hypothetical protein